MFEFNFFIKTLRYLNKKLLKQNKSTLVVCVVFQKKKTSLLFLTYIHVFFNYDLYMTQNTFSNRDFSILVLITFLRIIIYIYFKYIYLLLTPAICYF